MTTHHYEDSSFISASPEAVFAYADDFANFSSHMNQSSWMMAGSKMDTEVDEGKGQTVGSHVKMSGNVLGIHLFLDEVITIHAPPYHKEWQTVGEIKLLVISHYSLGLEIKPENNGSRLKVYIDYDLPKTLAGIFFGGMYAKWCVSQMINGVKVHFSKTYIKGGDSYDG